MLSEDFFYPKLNELETGKPAPAYTSTMALMRVLYEEKHLSFSEYLEYFGYLSSYRLKHLSVSVEDMVTALLGEGSIAQVDPTRLHHFNFRLTLSEEYGVPFELARVLMAKFLFKLVIDGSILSKTLHEVFLIVVKLFPTKMNRKLFGHSLLNMIFHEVKNMKILLVDGVLVNEKFQKMLLALESLNPGLIL